MGVGVVVCYNSGSVLAALATVVPFIIDLTINEAVVAWKAINFCNDLGFHKVIFEGDALAIASALCLGIALS